MPNTNSQTIHQMGQAINAVVRQATGRDAVQNIDMDWVTVAQNKTVQVFSESVPYIFRRTGGGMNIGNARLSRNKVIGGTLAWNQIYNMPTESITRNGVVLAFDGSTGGVTLTGTATGDIAYAFHTENISDSHKILVVGCPAGGIVNETYWMRVGKYAGGYLTADVGGGVIVSRSEGLQLQINCKSGYEFGSVGTVFKPQVFDLTRMFGSTIADYIYSLEQTTTGAGVAWCRKYFTDSYYDYNAGELLSVSGLVSHDMTGFNQYDKNHQNIISGYFENNTVVSPSPGRGVIYIPCFPNTAYCASRKAVSTNERFYIGWTKEIPANGITIFDSSGVPQTQTIGNTMTITTTTGADAKYIAIWVYWGNYLEALDTLCINFSNPDLNGRYEPYQLYSYPLDSDLILRGIPKLDTDNNLYYDGDVYEHDGKVTRKYGVVDLGSLTWTYRTNYNNVFTSSLTTLGGKVRALVVCPKYVVHQVTYLQMINGEISTESAGIDGGVSMLLIKDSTYTDAATFKAAMSGVYLVYELATPSTETADPFTDPQVVSPYGTEEYISTGIVPVGNETQYLELSDTNM